MAEIILKKAIKRQKGYLYFVDGEGNVCRAKLQRGRSKTQTNKREYNKKQEEEFF